MNQEQSDLIWLLMEMFASDWLNTESNTVGEKKSKGFFTPG